MKPHRYVAWSTAAIAVSLAACGLDAGGSDSFDPDAPTFSGIDVLEYRTIEGEQDNYELATMSFEYATVVDDGRVNNDWDLLFTRDGTGRDAFVVNTVTDDRSWIVDLREGGLDMVPTVIDPEQYATGIYGNHDYIPVLPGHRYVVGTLDGDTDQLAAFRVHEHSPADWVEIVWLRSARADRFVPPR